LCKGRSQPKTTLLSRSSTKAPPYTHLQSPHSAHHCSSLDPNDCITCCLSAVMLNSSLSRLRQSPDPSISSVFVIFVTVLIH
jgi:hypothetical protein